MKGRIGEEEGRRSHAYKDSEKHWTIGIGHNIDADATTLESVTGHPAADYIPQVDSNGDGEIDKNDDAKRTLTEAEIDKIFEHDWADHLQRALNDVPDLKNLAPGAQEAVVDFVYNN